MRKCIVKCLIIMSFGGLAFAQSETAAKKSSIIDAGEVKGISVSVVKPLLDAKLTAGALGFEVTEKADLEDALGLSIGYKKVSTGMVGFMGGLTFIDSKIEEDGDKEKVRFTKLDGNATYGFNDLAYVKGGLNLSGVTGGDGPVEKYIDEFGAGYQVGFGLQMTKNFALDVSYVYMQQKGEIAFVDLELEEKGLELGLSGTF